MFFSGYLRSAMVSGATAYTGSEYTLGDLPKPFVMENSQGIKTYVLVPSSSSHGPCGAAHTMDTMGGVLIAYTLGVDSGKIDASEKLVTSMDSYSYLSSYNAENAKVTMEDVSSNLIVIGGPGINQVSYYYNELRDAEWNKVLPVVYVKDTAGDYLHVQSSGAEYRIERDIEGRVAADYGVIQIFRDGVRYALLVYGLGGEGTRAAAEVLSNYESWNITGRATIVKYRDGDGDGFLDTISIVETVEAPEVTIEIYHESGCTNPVSSVDWGMVEPGGSSNVTVYVKNLEDIGVTLYLTTQNWDPSEASQYVSLGWNYTGVALEPEECIPIELTLTVSANATGLTDFSFEIVVTGEG